jgi:hypothetical protein
VLKRLRSVTPTRCSLEKCTHIQPLFIHSLQSVPSPSGGWILWIATQLWLGGINTLSWPYITLLSGSKAMPTIKCNGKIVSFFMFNQIIARFIIPSEIVTVHGSHFQNEMMKELVSKLGFKHGHSSPYYPQENGQVEAMNKSLKTILQKNFSQSKSD